MKKKMIILISSIIILILVIILLFFSPFLKIKLIGSNKVDLGLNINYEELGYKAYILGKDITNKVKISSNIDSTKIGKYKVTYLIKYGLTTKKIVRTISVKDLEPPIITLEGESNILLCPNNEYKELGYKAIDNLDGDITNKVEVENKDNVLKYRIKDSSGNESVVERYIQVGDKEAPKISLEGDSIVSIIMNSKYTDKGAKAIDNCDGDVTTNINTSNNINTSKIGTYEVKYTVSDKSGNETSLTRTVKVVNKASEYNDVVGPTYIKGILIVNKKYSLPSSFGGSNTTANNALSSLQSAAISAGYKATLVSGYRSYSTQQSIYNNYIKRWGQEYTDKVSAKPGHSEHQTGLAFDVGELSSTYGDTNEGKWLASNCYKYGFILRYPKGKESITGYNYEPWHIRYVGVEVATYIMQNKITLEEYLGV